MLLMPCGEGRDAERRRRTKHTGRAHTRSDGGLVSL